MPRFYFDTECGTSRYHDPGGIELASLDEARHQLAALLRDLTYSEFAGAVDIRATATVRCGGAVVLEGTCRLTVGDPAP